MKISRIIQKIGSILSVVAAVFMALTNCQKTVRPDGFITFDEHVENVAKAKFSDYKALSGALVRDEAEFEKMKQHILFMYKGISVQHSFMDDDDVYVDCIPGNQQPSLKQGGLATTEIDVAPAPNVNPAGTQPDDGGQPSQIVDIELQRGDRDKFGNEQFCPNGSIPMQRLTLETMVRFETLDDFFSKDGKGGGSFGESSERAAESHYYAHAYQNVNNYGGDSWLNIWNPTVSTNNFSLSQQWYYGGTGNGLQTIEGGWQVYTAFYGTNKARLFIYSTTANYAPGSGYYNLTGPGFIQTNNTIVLGSAFTNYSTTNGTQYGFGMQWQRTSNGNWWLFFTGANGPIAVGYYPKSRYGSGQLASYAKTIDYGGEVTGTPHALKMGSGAYAATGWKKAAYQRNMFYIKTNNATAWANLIPSIYPSNCYTIAYTGPTGTGDWVTYFYFGGPSCN